MLELLIYTLDGGLFKKLHIYLKDTEDSYFNRDAIYSIGIPKSYYEKMIFNLVPHGMLLNYSLKLNEKVIDIVKNQKIDFILLDIDLISDLSATISKIKEKSFNNNIKFILFSSKKEYELEIDREKLSIISIIDKHIGEKRVYL